MRTQTTGDGVFALHLQSLKVHKVLETDMLRPYMVFDGFLVKLKSCVHM